MIDALLDDGAEPRAPRAGAGRPWWRRRSTIAAAAVAAIAVAAIVLVDTSGDASGGSGEPADRPATALATVEKRSLSSQDEVSGTLGYADAHQVMVPVGTPGATLAQDRAALAQAQARVSADQQAVATAQAGGQDSTQVAAARAELARDTDTLEAARQQLAADRRLGCPPASAATVTTPIGSGSTGSATPPSTSAGTSRTSTVAASAARPDATTGTAQPTTTAALLSGAVNPHGSATSYYFRYGTSAALPQRSAVSSAGSGTGQVEVTAHVAGLVPDTAYGFQLVTSNAAGTTTGDVETFRTSPTSCAAQEQVVTADTLAVAAARDSLAAAQRTGGEAVAQAQQQLTADQAIAAADQRALTQARQQASTGSASVSPAQTVTALPSSGAVVRRGQSVYALDGRPVPLLYGTTIPWRALSTGAADGPDVTQLEDNLVALGYGAGLTPDAHFAAATTAAVKRWQAALGEPRTGVVELGAYLVEPGPIRIVTLTAQTGQPVQPGSTILSASSTTRQVVVDLDATQQTEVHDGDTVRITLPDYSTTPGVVSAVGAVATAPSAASGNNAASGTSTSSGSTQPPTITVTITPGRPRDTGRLDLTPVTVAITTATVQNALVVPVTALLALAGGGYALEVVPRAGAHRLVAVRPGLFDDADGLVQVTGTDLRAGQRIVVPAKP